MLKTKSQYTRSIIAILAFSLYCLCLFPSPTHAQSTPLDCANINRTTNVWQAISNNVPGTSVGSAQNAIDTIVCRPTPRITIPGLSFATFDVLKDQVQDEGGSIYIAIPFLAEYIAAVYKYLVAVASVISVIIIVIYAMRWITSASNPEIIKQAQHRILQGLMGLLLTLGTYVILSVINPDLVQFKPLRVQIIEGVQEFDDSADYDCATGASGPHPMQPSNGIPTNLNAKDQCIFDTFFTGKHIGDEPDMATIQDAFGIPGLTASVNVHSKSAWEAAMNDVANSNDPEVIGFLRWMAEFRSQNVPDLSGTKDGRGTISSNSGRIGFNKNDCPLEHFSYSMHSTGLALDFMTRSNWDVHTSAYSGTRGQSATTHCTRLKAIYEGNRNGVKDLIENPAFALSRIPGKIDECIAENLPWSSIPDEFVRIFENHGFYWGGRGWGNAGKRSDSMHFEYLGACAGL